MSASVTDKFRKASSGTRPIVTSLGSDKTNGSTTATIAAATGWNITTGVDLIIYRTDTSGVIVAGSQTDWIATLSGTTLSDMTLKAGTEPATGYPAGAQSVVICSPTAAWADSLIDGILTHADQDGTLKAGSVDVAGVLASNVVTTAKILNANVTPDKLATGADSSQVLTQEATTSTSFTDLTTVGPADTVTIGANGLALVLITGTVFNGTTGDGAVMSWAISGANTLAASDDRAISFVNNSTTNSFAIQGTAARLHKGLTPGSTTFTTKYRAAGGGTATFTNRSISVIPL